MNRNLLIGALLLGAIVVAAILLFGLPRGSTAFEFSQLFSREEYVCDGEFEIPVVIRNPLTTAENVSLQLRDANNIANGSLSTSQITLNAGAETVIEVFGKLIDACSDGTINLLASGDRISGLFSVEAQAFGVDGAAPNGRTPDNTGFFDYSDPAPRQPVTFTCCGVGFSGDYTVQFIPSENVNLNNLTAVPDQFTCDREEDHEVNITGNLDDLSQGAIVRARVRTPLGGSCRVVTPIEPAR